MRLTITIDGIENNHGGHGDLRQALQDLFLILDYEPQIDLDVLLGHPLADKITTTFRFSENAEPEDICGICGQPGADKMAMHTGGGIYWPGEFVPEGDMVHSVCEKEETRRAHSQLSQTQRYAFLRSI